MSLNTGMSRTSMLMYVDNSIHQIKHLDITLEVVSPSDRHGRIYKGHFHKKGQITVKTWRSIFNPVGTSYLCSSIDICMPFDTYVL